MTTTINMGGTSVFTKTQGINFANGTTQLTASNSQADSIQAGVAIFTGGTSTTVAFTAAYVAASAPIVIVTGLDGVYTHSLFFSISVLGTSGAWTGFTLNLSGSLLGAFNWIAIGNPN